MLIPSSFVVGKPDLELWPEIIAEIAQVLLIVVGGLWAYNRFFSRKHVRVHADIDVIAKRLELKDGPVIKIRVTVRNVGPTRLGLLYEASKCRIDGMTGPPAIGIPPWKSLVPEIPLFEEDYNKLTPPTWYARGWSHDPEIRAIRSAEKEVEELSAPSPVDEKKPSPVDEKKPSPVDEKKPSPVDEKKPSPVDEKKLRDAKRRLRERRDYADQFVEAGEEYYEEQLIRIPESTDDEEIVAYRVFTQVSCRRARFANIRQAVVIVDGGQPSTSDAAAVTGAA